MKGLIFYCICVFTVLPVYSQTNGQEVSAAIVSFPAYEEIKGMPQYYDKATYTSAIADKNLVVEKIFYYSDSLKVVCYIAKPKDISAQKRYPVIIFNRGGYVRNDIAFVHAPLFKKFTDSGFIVIAPALRESDGSEGKDEMGGNDLQDIWNILPLLRSRSYLDTSNLFMYGESRGGVMTLQLLGAGFPVKAAATVGAFTDFGLYIKENPGIENLCRQIWPAYDKDTAIILKQRSAIRWADQVNTPLLLMAGNADRSVNPHHTLEFAKQLNNFHKKYQVVLLNGGNHILSGQDLVRRDAEIINWFRQHLDKF